MSDLKTYEYHDHWFIRRGGRCVICGAPYSVRTASPSNEQTGDNDLESALEKIAAWMKGQAFARPGYPFRHSFAHGARIVVWFDSRQLTLRIARQGTLPKYDVSAKGNQRRKGWDKECETFCNAFGVPTANRAPENISENECDGFYFRIYAWLESVSQTSSVGVGNESHPL